jgi:cytochrome o ubiquinol oxidase operon protein cyoD
VRAARNSSNRPSSRCAETRTYTIGYGLALLLTIAAFATVYWQSLASRTTLGIVLPLGLAQMIAHLHFFLHISFRDSARTDLLLIRFSTLIIALMVSGTLVVLFNLRARMI